MEWQRIHERPLSLVAALSAHIGKAERRRCSEAGMIRGYEKPLNRETAEELLMLIKKPLRYKKSRSSFSSLNR